MAPTFIFAAARAPNREILLPVAVIDPDGELIRLTVRWGDGRTTVRRLESGDRRRRILRLSHRYRSQGKRRIVVTAVSEPGAGCGEADERSSPGRVTVRPRRRR